MLNIFLQVFEDGRLTDSQGRTVYFSNCTIIMTSNIGAAKAFTRQKVIEFTPEFINRVDEIVTIEAGRIQMLFDLTSQQVLAKIN